MAKKKANSSKYIKIVVAIVLIIAVAFGVYYMFFDKRETVNNDSEISKTTDLSNESALSTKPSTAETTEPTTEEKTTNTSITTTKQTKNYELPLSINQALNALEEHYGDGYDINATVAEDGINYFALYKNDEKYASVAVNLSTGEATETIMETNKKTDFYLV